MNIPPLFLETERLLVRNYRITDAADLFSLVNGNREELKEYFPNVVENLSSVMAARKYILLRNRERSAAISIFSGVFLRKEEKLIGQIIVKDINQRVPKGEAGYFLAKEFYGNGFASEALKKVTDYFLGEQKFAKLMCRIENRNSASRKVAEKAGYTFSGTLRNDFRTLEGRLMDCEVWEKTSSPG
ncbi:MAG TPA: GNAT family N-acetyltransferase [Bacteroidia bacterium]|nr:GNAT family N-acetyltransferase [Bacteroidia bacterium]